MILEETAAAKMEPVLANNQTRAKEGGRSVPAFLSKLQ
jgi:hypothetical protein